MPLTLLFFRVLFISALNPVLLEMLSLQTHPAGRAGGEPPSWETLPQSWGTWGCAIPAPGSPGVRALPHVPISHLFPPKPWFGQEGRVLLRPRGAMFSLGHSARNPRLPMSHVTLSPLSRRHIPLPPPRGRHDPSCCCCDASKHPLWFQSVNPGGWFYFFGGVSCIFGCIRAGNAAGAAAPVAAASGSTCRLRPPRPVR